MRRPPRPATPSAIDGYQRLRRGTTAAPPHRPDALPAGVLLPAEVEGSGAARSWRRRLVGATRLAGLVAVLAIIVGASVGLASSDATHPRSQRERTAVTKTAGAALVNAAATKVATVAETARVAKTTPVAKAAPATASTARTKVVADMTPAATPATATAVTERTTVAAPARDLPFTGDRTAPSLLLGGAALVLLGMLLQISGQPLSRPRVGDSASLHA